MLAGGPYSLLAIGRNAYVFAVLFAATHISEKAGLAVRGIQVNGPYLLLGGVHAVGGICHFLLAIGFAAAGIDGGTAIGREPEAGYGLAVILVVVGYLASGEVRRVGHPHIARPLDVKDPGHPLGTRSG